MPESQLTVTARTETGTSASRRVRTQGNIPAVVYGKESSPVHIVVSPTELEAAISGGIFTVLNLQGIPEIDGKTVMIREVQRHPLRRNILHIDFLEIKKGHKLAFTVPINIIGKAKGAVAGGELNVIKYAIAMTCLPREVPSSIDIDVSELEIGDSIKLKDIDLPESAELTDDLEDSIIEIKKRASAQEAEAGEGEGAEAGEEAAADTAGSSEDKGSE